MVDIRTHDDFVMIKHSDLHEIKLFAKMVQTFLPTYAAYNRKLNSIIKLGDKVSKIGEGQ